MAITSVKRVNNRYNIKALSSAAQTLGAASAARHPLLHSSTSSLQQAAPLEGSLRPSGNRNAGRFQGDTSSSITTPTSKSSRPSLRLHLKAGRSQPRVSRSQPPIAVCVCGSRSPLELSRSHKRSWLNTARVLLELLVRGAAASAARRRGISVRRHSQNQRVKNPLNAFIVATGVLEAFIIESIALESVWMCDQYESLLFLFTFHPVLNIMTYLQMCCIRTLLYSD